jgi:hypothetical protein
VSAPRPAAVRSLLAGAVLMLVGLAAWALYAVQSGREAHAYTAGQDPPAYVRLIPGHTYSISIPGGLNRLPELGVQPTALQCTAAAPGQVGGSLAVAAEQNTKATDRIASFQSRLDGKVHIECARVGAVFVDDAADAGFDWSGAWIVLTSIALAVGIPLTLSGLRGLPGAGGRRSDDGGDEPDDGRPGDERPGHEPADDELEPSGLRPQN